MPSSSSAQTGGRTLRPSRRVRVVAPPRAADVAIIGAGAAGIAAARRCLALGLSVALIEARPRVGGRAFTADLAGQSTDIGAHWLHAARANGLVAAARAFDLPLFDAPREPLLVVGAREASAAETRALHGAWEALEDAIGALAQAGDVAPCSDALASLAAEHAEHAATAAFTHGPFSCGAELAQIGAADFAAAEDDFDLFVAEGYGALVSRLADGLPIALDTKATRIDWSGAGVAVETARGRLQARFAIVTVPVPVLQAAGLVFDPPLPDATTQAIGALRPAAYEHVVLDWPGGPFREGANRTVVFSGGPEDRLGLLANFDGGHRHYADLGGALAAALPDADARAEHVRASLAARFGARATAGLRVLHASDWGEDPLSAGAWAYAPPGAYHARAALRDPVGERLVLAGEATSLTQWGTIGGAWSEGERAARIAAASLKGAAAGAPADA